MKQTKQVEVDCCDKCGPEEMTQSCDCCGRTVCWGHRAELVDLQHGVYVSGHGDASYCKPCLEELRLKKDKRVLAYLKIQDLRDEAKKWGEDFRRRCELAEEAVKRVATK